MNTLVVALASNLVSQLVGLAYFRINVTNTIDFILHQVFITVVEAHPSAPLQPFGVAISKTITVCRKTRVAG
ncbi:hypothetical protein CONLIGDRAFT_517473 [Coniochaeta ligniaria NRRL 30616]|uniref:Secreted protein n=1 Tax=Coniochaeta ligniaria NRRL 30616 TaxID=1408157 RepID=A0A1J7JA46_9PEZI|nr:hypothetical protein CONLIGDRAFT_517473 [Coniochaeta ligniaria NRRL 30616]